MCLIKYRENNKMKSFLTLLIITLALPASSHINKKEWALSCYSADTTWFVKIFGKSELTVYVEKGPLMGTLSVQFQNKPVNLIFKRTSKNTEDLIYQNLNPIEAAEIKIVNIERNPIIEIKNKNSTEIYKCFYATHMHIRP